MVYRPLTDLSVGYKQDVKKEDIQDWIAIAQNLGYFREDPRKPWSEREYKEAIRYVLENLASKALEDHTNRFKHLEG